MKLKHAKEQIEREHPEFTHSQKIAAIKALRDAAREAERAAKDAREEPTEPTGEAKRPMKTPFVLRLLIAYTISGTIVSAIGIFVDLGNRTSGLGWPMLIHPRWAGVVAGLVGLGLLGQFAGYLDRQRTRQRPE